MMQRRKIVYVKNEYSNTIQMYYAKKPPKREMLLFHGNDVKMREVGKRVDEKYRTGGKRDEKPAWQPMRCFNQKHHLRSLHTPFLNLQRPWLQ